MGDASVFDGTVFEGAKSTALFLGRAYWYDGTLVTQGAVSTAVYTLYDLGYGGGGVPAAMTGHTAVSLTIADVIHDTLQTDGRWEEEDDDGYNVEILLDASANAPFPLSVDEQKNQYMMHIVLTPTVGQVIEGKFQVKTL